MLRWPPVMYDKFSIVSADDLVQTRTRTVADTVLMNFGCITRKYIYDSLQSYGDSIASTIINTLRPRQNGRHFTDDTFNRILWIKMFRILIKFSLMFVPKGPINNIPALVQIMAWRHPGDKPLSEPVMVSLLTHICVTRPQWVKLQQSCNKPVIWAVLGDHPNIEMLSYKYRYPHYKRQGGLMTVLSL